MDTRSDAEKAFHQHITMWGSAGYPVHKLEKGRGWVWREFWGVRGAPTVYKTKRWQADTEGHDDQ